MHVAHIAADLSNEATMNVTLTGFDGHTAAREAAAEFIQANEHTIIDATVSVVAEWPKFDPILQAFTDALVDRSQRYTRDEIITAIDANQNYIEENIIFPALDECDDWLRPELRARRRNDRKD